MAYGFYKSINYFLQGLSLDPSNSGYQSNLDLIKDKLKEKKDPEPTPAAGLFYFLNLKVFNMIIALGWVWTLSFSQLIAQH